MRPRRWSSAADTDKVRARRYGLTKRGEGARQLRWCGRGTVKRLQGDFTTWAILVPSMAPATLRCCCCACCGRARGEGEGRKRNASAGSERASAGRVMSCCSSMWPERSGRRQWVAPHGGRALSWSATEGRAVSAIRAPRPSLTAQFDDARSPKP